MEGMFRIIQSIPSKKAESFKQWMAKVARERIDEFQDPEKAIERGYEYIAAWVILRPNPKNLKWPGSTQGN